jgi:hypothetical protein
VPASMLTYRETLHVHTQDCRSIQVVPTGGSSIFWSEFENADDTLL